MRTTTASHAPGMKRAAPLTFAEHAQLVYVSDAQPGITRLRKGKGFAYRLKGRSIKDADTLRRIRSLVIPPAWKNVWICVDETGHLQATGYDVAGRKQYRYHPKWNELRNETKFDRLKSFGGALKKIRARIRRDMALPGMSQEKVLATVVNLMELTGMRVGNNEYEKLYGSYGLTTMKDKHVQLRGPQIRFEFKGKKGVQHSISLRNKRLAKIVKQCRDIPGKELFQYYDSEGVRRSVDSGMVNNYLKEITGEDFTSKDFRTWSGTICALVSLKAMDQGASLSKKEKINTILDQVARHLGNTRAVCRKYYVHPLLLELAEQNENAQFPLLKPVVGLNEDEQTLLQLLRKAA